MMQVSLHTVSLGAIIAIAIGGAVCLGLCIIASTLLYAFSLSSPNHRRCRSTTEHVLPERISSSGNQLVQGRYLATQAQPLDSLSHANGDSGTGEHRGNHDGRKSTSRGTCKECGIKASRTTENAQTTIWRRFAATEYSRSETGI
ncbi:hypothetical protein MRB53_041377 [Persea americana]|nr:hypothetical protein MRB53_041377 [Persea americana]